MRGLLLILVALTATCPFGLADDPPKDTLAAAHTRHKRLKCRVTVDFKEVELADAVKAISRQLEDQKVGALSVWFGPGASKLTKVTYSAKDQPLEVVLDGLLGPHKLGYYVISKPGDRTDGWLFFDSGPERGYPPGVNPPVEKKKEFPLAKNRASGA